MGVWSTIHRSDEEELPHEPCHEGDIRIGMSPGGQGGLIPCRKARRSRTNRLVAEVLEKGLVGRDVCLRQARRQRQRALPQRLAACCGAASATVGIGQAERRLTPADQLDIDVGKELGVEKRAVLGRRELSMPKREHSASRLAAAPGKRLRAMLRVSTTSSPGKGAAPDALSARR